MDHIEIHDLSPERLEDYLHFMEHDAFAGNPDWADCYCLEGHTVSDEVDDDDERTPQERRDDITERINAGGHHGLLAYREGRMVGWSHATPMLHLQYEDYRLGRDDEELRSIGAIVCFNLAESVRRAGLPGVLLRRALERFRVQGLTSAEAFPWKDPAPKPGRNYLGTVHLYELHGFTAVEERGDAVIMRRALSPRDPDAAR